MSEYKDSYLSVEHLILAIFDSRHSLANKLMNIPNFEKRTFEEAIKKFVVTNMSKMLILNKLMKCLKSMVVI